MDIFTLLFSFQGRINRAKYWLAVAIYIAAMVIVTAIGFATLSWVFFALLVIVYIPMVFSGVAVGIKRLHDRNKSGWWLVLFYFAPAVLSGAANATEMAGGNLLLSGASIAISIWALVELGFLRGTTGANRYGPDPLPV